MIRTMYSELPNFPATDQHPQAQRTRIGKWWVDYVGPVPTQADVDAVLSPPKVSDARLNPGVGNINRQEIEDLKAFLKERFNV